MATSYPRRLDLSTAADEHTRLAMHAANLCAELFQAGGSHISVPFRPAEVIVRGDTMKGGALIAAAELRDLLSRTPKGRQALTDLGYDLVIRPIESAGGAV